MNTSHCCVLLCEVDSSRQASVSSLCADRWADATAGNTIQRILNWTLISVSLCLSERPLNRLWQSYHYLAFNARVNTAPASHTHTHTRYSLWQTVSPTHTHGSSIFHLVTVDDRKRNRSRGKTWEDGPIKVRDKGGWKRHNKGISEVAFISSWIGMQTKRKPQELKVRSVILTGAETRYSETNPNNDSLPLSNLSP